MKLLVLLAIGCGPAFKADGPPTPSAVVDTTAPRVVEQGIQIATHWLTTCSRTLQHRDVRMSGTPHYDTETQSKPCLYQPYFVSIECDHACSVAPPLDRPYRGQTFTVRPRDPGRLRVTVKLRHARSADDALAYTFDAEFVAAESP